MQRGARRQSSRQWTSEEQISGLPGSTLLSATFCANQPSSKLPSFEKTRQIGTPNSWGSYFTVLVYTGVADSKILLAVKYAWREIRKGTNNQSCRLSVYPGQSPCDVSCKAGRRRSSTITKLTFWVRGTRPSTLERKQKEPVPGLSI